MPSKLIISVSGVRGIVGESLTEETVSKFAAALGSHVGGGIVVLSRDGRSSGEMLRHAALAGLVATGCAVHDLGVAPTPTCGLAIRKLNAVAGLQITASHNPAEWNGLKLFGPDGRVVSADNGARIRATYESGEFNRRRWNQLVQVAACDVAPRWHLDTIIPLINATPIRERGFRVILDANGGSGGPIGVSLLNQLGWSVVELGCRANGDFEHPPEPIAEHLRSVTPLVSKQNADIGFVLDPDADRLAIIDETGRYIGEELTLALAVKHRLQQKKGPVVINMSTSRVVQDVASEFGVPCHRSAVGEANVVDKMLRTGAVIGGEGNGGVIDPRVGLVRDPFIGMGMVLDLMAGTQSTLSSLVNKFPVYHIVKEKLDVDRAGLDSAIDRIEHHFSGASLDRLDGLRLDWKDHWVHVRPSNTEPVVRVIAEAPEKETAETLCREVGECLEVD